MWVKKTVVKTKSGSYTYIQLIHSERIQGKTRHRVLANLGRADKLDLSQVNGLVEAISSSAGDSLEMEQILLLPSKKYGTPMLLAHQLDTLGIQRFLSDLAVYKKIKPEVTHTFFALLVYYASNMDASQAFFDFIQQYTLISPDKINRASVEAAIRLLANPLSIRESLLTQNRKDGPCFHYVYRSINDNLKEIADNGVILIVLDTHYDPVDFQSMKYLYPKYTLPSSLDVFVSDSFSVLRECESFDPRTSRYICRLTWEEIPEVFYEKAGVLDFARAKGVFHRYKDIGYRFKHFGRRLVIITRPGPGVAGRITPWQTESREILVTTVDGEPEEILERYYYLEKIQSYYFNIYIPPDLTFLYKKLPARRILYAIQNVIFVKILCFDSIEKQVRGLGLTADDVIQECDSIRGAQLHDGNSLRRFHSKFTPLQTSILHSLGIRKPPTLNFTPAPRPAADKTATENS